MSGKLKYSIIIPAYNSEKTLARCLESLIEQGRNDIQIIIIDDGSTDNTDKIGIEFSKKNESIIYHRQENAGVSVARNIGLELSNAEYISFVDSDDYVMPGYFDILDQINGHDLLVFDSCCTGGSLRDGTEIFADLLQRKNYEQRLMLLLSSKKIMPPWNKCFSNAIIKKHNISFPVGIHIGEDFNFCLEYTIHCKSIAVDTRKAYCVDVSGDQSLSRKYRANLDRQLFDVYILAEQTIRSSELLANHKNQLLTILDYLFVKNALTSIAEEFKLKKLHYFSVKNRVAEICELYQKEFSTERCNIMHTVLRILLKCHLNFVFYLLAYLAKGRTYRK